MEVDFLMPLLPTDPHISAIQPIRAQILGYLRCPLYGQNRVVTFEKEVQDIKKLKEGLMITFYLLKMWRDNRGQDFIEYALMASLVATSVGVVMPGWVFPTLSSIMSKVTSAMASAATAS